MVSWGEIEERLGESDSEIEDSLGLSRDLEQTPVSEIYRTIDQNHEEAVDIVSPARGSDEIDHSDLLEATLFDLTGDAYTEEELEDWLQDNGHYDADTGEYDASAATLEELTEDRARGGLGLTRDQVSGPLMTTEQYNDLNTDSFAQWAKANIKQLSEESKKTRKMLNKRTLMGTILGTFATGAAVYLGITYPKDDGDSGNGGPGTPKPTETATPTSGQPEYVVETDRRVDFNEFGENCLTDSQYKEVINWAESGGRDYNPDELEVEVHLAAEGVNVNFIYEDQVVGTDEYNELQCGVR